MSNLFYEQLKKQSEPDTNNIRKFTAQLAMDVEETQDEFIFRTIEPFIKSQTDIVISKQELCEAISLLRMQKQCRDLYGVMWGNCDIRTATQITAEVAAAYNRGVKAGMEKMRTKMLEMLEGREYEHERQA